MKFWTCEKCKAQNSEYDSDCQYCGFCVVCGNDLKTENQKMTKVCSKHGGA
jgi:hypothetical protein